jgi:hypothetical protein
MLSTIRSFIYNSYITANKCHQSHNWTGHVTLPSYRRSRINLNYMPMQSQSVIGFVFRFCCSSGVKVGLCCGCYATVNLSQRLRARCDVAKFNYIAWRHFVLWIFIWGRKCCEFNIQRSFYIILLRYYAFFTRYAWNKMSVCPHDLTRESLDAYGWNLVWTLCHWGLI